MRRPSLRSVLIASLLALCVVSCGLLMYTLSSTDYAAMTKDLPGMVRSCTESTYDVQYCLGLVPTEPSMYPALYYPTSHP